MILHPYFGRTFAGGISLCAVAAATACTVTGKVQDQGGPSSTGGTSNSAGPTSAGGTSNHSGASTTAGTSIGAGASSARASSGHSVPSITGGTSNSSSRSGETAPGSSGHNGSTGTPGSSSRAATATLLFQTDFTSASFRLDAPILGADGWGGLQAFEGVDLATGRLGPISVLGTTRAAFQLIAGQRVLTNLSDYVANTLEQVTGPHGNPVSALYQIVKDNSPAINSTGTTQNAFELYRGGAVQDTGDIYYTYWFMFQSDLHTQLTAGGNGNWRAMSEWKTTGDYRISTVVAQDGNGHLYWATNGDNNANGGLAIQNFWHVDNATVPVPAGEWFQYEVFWHRSSAADGRYWAAANGQVIVDHTGPNIGVNHGPVDRIMLSNVYSGGHQPVRQWVTGLEIWDGFPCGVGISCYTP